jgi:geranylgeranyl transferase type-2 subunit beta
MVPSIPIPSLRVRRFVLTLQNKTSFQYFATEHFRLSGVYWGLTALYLMDKLELIDREDVVAWVLSCQHPCGGFGGSERHDPHLLYTLSALQILALYDELDRVDRVQISSCKSTGMLHGQLHVLR